MKLTPLGIEGAWLAESSVWSDDRGFFREWFKDEDINKVTGRSFNVEQANISSSVKGTLRGIHYSLAEEGQAKWVTCVSGLIKDVIVDIRPNSKTFGKWIEVEISGTSGNAVLIGEGLGHGFISLVDVSTVAYLVSSPFSLTEEFEINPLDPALGINWGLPIPELKISDKDQKAPTLEARKKEGKLPIKDRISN
jgi:dTDP-4-dehydrorhamnose 3,5-epimerase